MSMLIGLTGPPGCGKDTAAAHLVKDHGFARLAFADPIRQVALAIDPYVHLFRLSEVVDMLGWEKAKQQPECRRLLQVIGTEAGRDIHGTDVWVDKTFATIQQFGPDQPVVITDVRFDNEARRLRTFGGRLVRVRRRPANHDAVLGHRSETESAKLNSDHYLPNDGSVTELHRRLDRLVDRLDKQRRPA